MQPNWFPFSLLGLVQFFCLRHYLTCFQNVTLCAVWLVAAWQDGDHVVGFFLNQRHIELRIVEPLDSSVEPGHLVIAELPEQFFSGSRR